MTPLAFLVPGRLDTRTGGYEYDRRLIAGLQKRGWSVQVRELPGPFPDAEPAAVEAAGRACAALPAGTTVVVDGLAFGAAAAIMEREAGRLAFVGLVHMPLAAGVAADAAAVERLDATERRALHAASLVVTTGASTLQALARHGIELQRVVVVEPGTERGALARGSRGPARELLCVAAVNAGKGHEDLFHALSTAGLGDWHLTCAGTLERDPETATRVRAVLRDTGLGTRVSLAGELDARALAGCYEASDLFVLATRHETYGMAVAEALGHGLPVISTTTGAIPGLVTLGGATAGLLVEPGNVAGLAGALSRVLHDDALLARLAAGARQAREHLPTWDEAADRMGAALRAVEAGAGRVG